MASGPSARQVIDAAAQYVGYTESPAGSNRNQFASRAGHANGQPWCASFVVAVGRECGIRFGNESAYTPSLAGAFQAAGRWHGRSEEALPGDIVFFDFPDSVQRIQHVGIVVRDLGDGRIETIEGNTSSGNSGSQANGGGVFDRIRPKTAVVGYGRPEYDSEGDDDMTAEQAAQLAAVTAQMDWLLRYLQGVTFPQIQAVAVQCDYLTRRAQAEDQA